MRDFGKRKYSSSSSAEEKQSFFGKFSFSGNANTERMDRLKNFGQVVPAENLTSRADSVLSLREQIIKESRGEHRELDSLRNQIGSWKTEINEEEIAKSRTFASDFVRDDKAVGLLDQLRKDISFFGDSTIEQKDEENKTAGMLSELRNDISGLFGNVHSVASIDENNIAHSKPVSRKDIPYNKDEKVSSSVIAEEVLDVPQVGDIQDEVSVEDDQSSVVGIIDRADSNIETNSDSDLSWSEGRSNVSQISTSEHSEQGEVFELLDMLKNDITRLSEEPESPSVKENDEVRNLLAEMKNDILELKEQKNSSSNGDLAELYSLITDLKKDISTLKEQDKQPLVPEVNEILSLFAELKGDISTLKEGANQPLVPQVDEILGLFSELKGDISSLKEQRNQPLQLDEGELQVFLTDLNANISSLKDQQTKQPHQSDNAILEMLVELHEDLETLKDGQMKTVELAQNAAVPEFHNLLKELRNDIVNLTDEQATMRSQLSVSKVSSNPASDRIHDLLNQLNDEFETSRKQVESASNETKRSIAS